LAVEQGLGEVTVEGYLKAVKKFIMDTGGLFPSKDTVVGYLAAFRKANYSYSHIRNTTRAMCWYLGFWGIELKLKNPKKPERLIKEILTSGEIRKLLTACRNLKAKAIVALLAYTGIRTGELKRLRVEDLDFENLTVRIVQGKNFRDREICASAESAKILQRHIKRQRKTSRQLVFGDRRDRPVSAKSLKKIFNQAKRRAGISKRIYVYIFRHSLATNMLLNGADIMTVQKQLGHKDVRTTLGYISHTPEIYKKQYRRFVPKFLSSQSRRCRER